MTSNSVSTLGIRSVSNMLERSASVMGTKLTKRSLSLQLDQLTIAVGIEQAINFGGIVRPHVNHPPLLVGRLVDPLRMVREPVVARDDLAGDRRKKVGCRL